MATQYTKHYNTKKTSQTTFIPGREKEQTKNSAGGVSFKVDPWDQLDRFLVLGTEGGTYYASEKTLTVKTSNKVVELIQEDGFRALNRTVDVSLRGLAPKNDPAIYTLALICTFAEPEVKSAAYTAISKVCRTGTHLFTFCQYVQDLRKWSAGLRRGVSRFYENRDAEKIALQLIKYRQRNGWTHADVIRLAHPKFPKGAEGLPLRILGRNVREKDIPDSWMAFEAMQTFTEKKDVEKAIELIEKHKLPWEAVPTTLHEYREIWEAMIPNMGYTALLRNLSRFSKLGILSTHGLDGSTDFISGRFADREELKKSRLHPLTILNGMKAYARGYSERAVYRHGLPEKTSTWDVSQQIVDILEGAFYSAFDNVTPTGLRYLFGLDISGSMTSDIAGMSISCREASVALALVSLRTEPKTYMMGFGHQFHELKITKRSTLGSACEYIAGLNFGGTDCSIPMVWAAKNKVPVDVFSIYTDNETFAGSIQPSQALEQYRQKMGIDAKLVVVGMATNSFTIADPADPRQLDVVGFSTDTPQAIATFAAGVPNNSESA